jgi:Flp pilus assembly protein TadG
MLHQSDIISSIRNTMRTSGSTLLKTVPRCISREDGNVAVVFALSIVPLLLAVGVAVDYGRYNDAMAKLQSSADLAALAAAASPGKDETRIEAGEEAFVNNTAELENPKIKLKFKGSSVEADATAELGTSLTKIAGIGKVALKVEATAESGSTDHYVYLILDQSASMGIAADKENQEKLMALTRPYIWQVGGWATDTVPNGCSFACHLPIDINPPGKTIYDLARENGVRIREDVVREGATQFISELLNSRPETKLATVGFSRDVVWLARLTKERSVLIDSLSKFPKHRRMDTPFEKAMPIISEEIQNESAGKKRTIVLVTDGVRTITDPFGLNVSATGPIDQDLCNEMKEDDTIVVVLEVKYEKDPDSIPYQHYVQSFEQDITPALKACATTGHFYSASDPDGIHQALSEIATGITTQTVRLSR